MSERKEAGEVLAKTAASNDVEPDRALRAFARRLYNERRLREAFIDRSLLGEAAWDLLLDLYASGQDGRQISISSACIAAAVPPTTALRYIDALQAKGFLVTAKTSADRRLRHVQLTDVGEKRMTQLLSRMLAERSAAGR